MMNWLRRLFRGRHAPDAVPAWAVELADLVQKAARAQARVGARLEGMESKLEGGFADLRVLVQEGRMSAVADPLVDLPWNELFDSSDLLDEAAGHLARQGEAEFSRGLIAVRERLDVFLAAAGFERVIDPEPAGVGTLFRVIAEAEQPAAIRCVRAAIRRGGIVVREGEVIIRKKDSTNDYSIRD